MIENDDDEAAVKQSVMAISIHAYPGRECGTCEKPATRAYVTLDKPKKMYFRCGKHPMNEESGSTALIFPKLKEQS